MSPSKTRFFLLLPQVWVLGVAPLVIWKGVWDQSLLPQYLAWCIGLFICLLLVRTVAPRQEAATMTFTMPKSLVPLLLFVGIAGASCLWARNPWEAVFEGTKYVLLCIWIMALLALHRAKSPLLRDIPRILVLTAACALALGYVQLIRQGMAEGGLSHHITYYAVSFFAHRNLFSEAMVLMMPYLVWGTMQDRGAWRWAATIVFFAAILLILLLQVRSSWLAIVAGLGATVVGLFWGKGELGLGKSTLRAIAGLAMLAGLAIGIGTVVYNQTRQSGSLVEVGHSILHPTYGSSQERVILWKKTLQIIWQRPWTGWGLHGWHVEMLSTGYQDLRLDTQLGKVMIDRTHNDFLQMWAETGIFGGLAWLATLLLGLGLAMRILRAPGPRENRRFALVPLASLTAYAVISCFSFPMERISHLIVLGTNLGLLATLAPASTNWQWSWPARVQRALGVAALLVIGTCGWLGWQRMVADSHLVQALMLRGQGDWKQMEQALEAGATPCYVLDPTGTPMRWYAGSAKFQRGDFKGAIDDFEAAYEANPYHLHVLNNLGAAWVQAGQPDSGLKYCLAAVELSPKFSEGWTNLGIIYFNTGKIDLAEYALLHVQDSALSDMSLLLMHAVTNYRLEELLLAVEELPLNQALSAILAKDKWKMNVYDKARTNRRRIREQLLLDAIYALEMKGDFPNFTTESTLRSKYLR